METGDPRPFVPWAKSPVPEEHQLRGMHAVRLWERSLAPTAALLTRFMGFEPAGTEDGWHRFVGTGGGFRRDRRGEGARLQQQPGQWGTGGVHHVAWRMADSTAELALRSTLEQIGLRPSQQIDRFWFRSVYFREPGGVLFELATDGPGFDRDEDMAHLGERLILPPWLEPQRAPSKRGYRR